MRLFPVLFWWAVIARSARRYNSWFGGFNSRLTANKFPVLPATGTDHHDIDFIEFSRDQLGTFSEQSTSFPAPRE
jgi:hypothetical protein